MGEPAQATEEERARRRELAQKIVAAVENDESVIDASGLPYARLPADFIAGELLAPVPPVEELLFALAQEIQQLLAEAR